MATNTFYDLLRPAEYKGVPFFVTEDTATFGRNIVNHEFIQRKKNFVEDLGTKTRELKFSAWIVANEGNDFNPFTNRDALIEAIEDGGYGTLIHPFYGEMLGVLHKATVKQATTEKGGLVSLELEFLEGGEKEIKAVAVVDSVGRVQTAAQLGYTSNASEFAGTYHVGNTQGFVLDDAYAMVKQFQDNLKTAHRYLGLVAQLANGNLSALAILREPLSLANQITSIIKDLKTTSSTIGFSRKKVPNTSTPARALQDSNQKSFVNLVRNAGLIRSAELALEITTQRNQSDLDLGVPQLYTRSELDTYRRELVYSITDQLINLSSLGIYPQTQLNLSMLRTEIVQHLTRVGETLGSAFFTNCEENTSWAVYMPTLPIVYRHYGELRSDEFNARNGVRNPLFNPPEAVMELLNV